MTGAYDANKCDANARANVHFFCFAFVDSLHYQRLGDEGIKDQGNSSSSSSR